MLRYLLLLCLLLDLGSATAAEYWRLRIDGPIGPGVSQYIAEQIHEAAEVVEPPRLIILQIDTPGGLVESMREINQAILGSSVPVVGYVYPSGARAASAGTYILYACHVAAMAPATHLGAATPVNMLPIGDGSPAPGSPADGEQKPAAERPPLDNQSALRNKQIHDAVANIRALAELRGRDAEWAEKAVVEGDSITAAQALDRHVIELLVADYPALLQALHGRRVNIKGQTIQLDTQGVVGRDIEPDWRQRTLQAISNPNIAYILMMLGIYGLILEFYSPGFGVAGVTGAICLLLALFSMQMLPLNYTGVALLLLGCALLVAEAFAPSFGILGAGGLVALLCGSLFLFDSPDGAIAVAWPVIAAMLSVALALLLLSLRLLVKARGQPLVSGIASMVGQRAVALESFNGSGRVRYDGEIWQARSEFLIAQGETVVINRVEGLVLVVSPRLPPTISTQERDPC